MASAIVDMQTATGKVAATSACTVTARLARTLWSFDTAVRHKLLLLCIISLYGSWTADSEGTNLSRPYVLPHHGAQRLGCGAEL